MQVGELLEPINIPLLIIVFSCLLVFASMFWTGACTNDTTEMLEEQ